MENSRELTSLVPACVKVAVRYRDSGHVVGAIEVDFPGWGRGGIDYFFCNWQALRHWGQGGCL